jgi:hypothetical protein
MANETGKHTPGPWKARKAGELTVEGSATKFPNHVVYEYKDNLGRRCTAFVAHCDSATLENEANARLIAAAPELLTELQKARDELVGWAAYFDTCAPDVIIDNLPTTVAAMKRKVESAEAAIRKATEGNASP